jgi:hypothetical protein
LTRKAAGKVGGSTGFKLMAGSIGSFSHEVNVSDKNKNPTNAIAANRFINIFFQI